MLVLSRQRDETIMIGDDIEITIVDIRGDKVRLGITAPATIPVHRKEVYDAIQRENREAAAREDGRPGAAPQVDRQALGGSTRRAPPGPAARRGAATGAGAPRPRAAAQRRISGSGNATGAIALGTLGPAGQQQR